MNEPSPEAKQAAEEGYSVEYIAAKRIADELAFRPPMPTQFDISAAVKIIRTATAKLREEFTHIKMVVQAYDKVINAMPMMDKIAFINSVPENYRKAFEQLAHHQPSATTPEKFKLDAGDILQRYHEPRER